MSEPYRLLRLGYRDADGDWQTLPLADGEVVRETPTRHRIRLACPGAHAVEAVFAAPETAQFLGGGERFDALDLRGQSIRFHLENQALTAGTYLPSPWITTTAGFALWLDGLEGAVFHLAPSWDPHRIRVQVDGDRLDLTIDLGDLAALYAALVARIGPPLMPRESFFGLWKAGDWRFENAATVDADREGFRRMGLPMAVKLIDAYWEDEVHSFAFDETKYPDAWRMVEDLAAEGCEVHLWLCPWVVVGTRSHEEALARGYTIRDADGAPITRRPGANPNIVAALIDYSNPEARLWWSNHLRALIEKGIAGFKADFGEQLPEHAVLYSGETGSQAHNSFVRHYLEATADAFGEAPPAIISRSGSPRVRTPIWSGDQTSDFCPKTGLPAAIRAAQSASLSGWSFVGSDLGGYFGTPTTQVFARWTQFSCFTPLMQLHGLGCREPWEMGAEAEQIFVRYARIHLALLPTFQHHGTIAAAGGPPLIRMMPLAFPDIDWRGRNDWDQQFMLGDALLVAPAAFYANTRAVHLPAGLWFDVMTQSWIEGGRVLVRETPLDAIPVFVREGGVVYLRDGETGRDAIAVAALSKGADRETLDAIPAPAAGGWRLARRACLGSLGADTIEHFWLGQLSSQHLHPER